MIIPYPQDIRKWQNYPLTWTLGLLNVFIFILIFSGTTDTFTGQKLLQAESLRVTGRLYYQYLNDPEQKSLKESAPTWIQETQLANDEQMEVLGVYALRDKLFLSVAEQRSFQGDAIRIEAWREDLVSFKKYYFSQILFLFGLSSVEQSPLAWITYQFSHSGWMHLLSNLIFLLVMGAAVEALAGSLALISVYMVGGIFGGWAFLFMNSHGAVPMVGASAAVSALLAFYAVAERRSRVRYIYFVSPLPHQNGYIYLPTLLIVPLFLAVDFASLMATPAGMGSGVAYAAHIGGTIAGMTMGLLSRISMPKGLLTKP